jgi:hypothetical protein
VLPRLAILGHADRLKGDAELVDLGPGAAVAENPDRIRVNYDCT